MDALEAEVVAQAAEIEHDIVESSVHDCDTRLTQYGQDIVDLRLEMEILKVRKL